MSASGHKHTSRGCALMFALTPKAAAALAERRVRSGPKGGVRRLVCRASPGYGASIYYSVRDAKLTRRNTASAIGVLTELLHGKLPWQTHRR